MMKLLKTDKNSHKSFMVEGRTVLEMGVNMSTRFRR